MVELRKAFHCRGLSRLRLVLKRIIGFRFSDHIAIPDMNWAMENWGLITYGEELLCIDNEVAGASAVVSAATVIGHEVSHQVKATFHCFHIVQVLFPKV